MERGEAHLGVECHHAAVGVAAVAVEAHASPSVASNGREPARKHGPVAHRRAREDARIGRERVDLAAARARRVPVVLEFLGLLAQSALALLVLLPARPRVRVDVEVFGLGQAAEALLGSFGGRPQVQRRRLCGRASK